MEPVDPRRGRSGRSAAHAVGTAGRRRRDARMGEPMPAGARASPHGAGRAGQVRGTSRCCCASRPPRPGHGPRACRGSWATKVRSSRWSAPPPRTWCPRCSRPIPRRRRCSSRRSPGRGPVRREAPAAARDGRPARGAPGGLRRPDRRALGGRATRLARAGVRARGHGACRRDDVRSELDGGRSTRSTRWSPIFPGVSPTSRRAASGKRSSTATSTPATGAPARTCRSSWIGETAASAIRSSTCRRSSPGCRPARSKVSGTRGSPPGAPSGRTRILDERPN